MIERTDRLFERTTLPHMASYRASTDEEEAYDTPPRELVGKYVIVDGKKGLVESFDRVYMPGGGHSFHSILFENEDAAKKVLLRRRKMMDWNPGRPFSVVKDPIVRPKILVDLPDAASDEMVREWMAEKYEFANPRQEGNASWSQEGDQPLKIVPLAEACAQGRLDIVHWLITSGGAKEDLEVPAHCRSCMHFAAYGGQVEVMEWLCSIGKQDQVHVIDQCGQTTCHFAAMCDSSTRGVECLKFLLRNGCEEELFKPDLEGDTVFHIAVLHGNVEICEWILNNPSKTDVIHIKNNEGETALDFALQEREITMCRWFYSLRTVDLSVEEKQKLSQIIEHHEEKELLLAII